jgi:hypothetical protein
LIANAESYKFLEECLKYSMLPVADVSAHYAAFQAVIAAFVAVNSPFEINISTSLRNKVQYAHTDTHRFVAMQYRAASASA